MKKTNWKAFFRASIPLASLAAYFTLTYFFPLFNVVALTTGMVLGLGYITREIYLEQKEKLEQ